MAKEIGQAKEIGRMASGARGPEGEANQENEDQNQGNFWVKGGLEWIIPIFEVREVWDCQEEAQKKDSKAEG